MDYANISFHSHLSVCFEVQSLAPGFVFVGVFFTVGQKNTLHLTAPEKLDYIQGNKQPHTHL